MPRLPLVLLALLLSGCISTTRTVADAGALAQADADLRGRHAVVNLVSGEQTEGRIRFVRPDLTSWDEETERAVFAPRTVPTTAVLSLVIDTRQRAVRKGVLIGAVAGYTLTALGVASLVRDAGGEDSASTGVAVGFLGVPSGALYGLGVGALVGRRTAYVLVPDSAAVRASAPAVATRRAR